MNDDADLEIDTPTLERLAAVLARRAAHEPRRVALELTEHEVRALVRAATLVADLARPDRAGAESPVVTACQKLVAACERRGIDLAAGMPGGEG